MMTNGTAVEVATVGDEGMLGITALWGGRSMPGETMCQVQDTSVERMPLDAFVREIERRGRCTRASVATPRARLR